MKQAAQRHTRERPYPSEEGGKNLHLCPIAPPFRLLEILAFDIVVIHAALGGFLPPLLPSCVLAARPLP